jgi:hypothetical protein
MRAARLVVRLGASAMACAALVACGHRAANVEFTAVNDSDVTVTVRISGTASELTVAPGETAGLTLSRCVGDGLLVLDDEGEVARLSGPACPAALLRIGADLSAAVEDDFG